MTREFLCVAALLIATITTPCTGSQSSAERPAVTAPPESFFELVGRGRGRGEDDDGTRALARAFYAKHLDIRGLPVAASKEVDDRALERTHEIVTHMLAGRPDVLAAMQENGMYLIVIGKDQVYTDMPEYRDHPDPQFMNERVRGTGGLPTSFGEENLLGLPVDRYDDESIAVHEFCHTIDGTLRQIDPSWTERKQAAFEHARQQGLWERAYAGGNAGEYWAEIAQSYFDCNRVNNWNHGPIGRREQLEVYDPEGYELCRTTFQLNPDQDWRYRWIRRLPDVGPPPEKLGIDGYYTKFSWAREFVVLGRTARDEALLHANETIRRTFAYRHDVLKALIAEGLRLVVLGPEEKISDLPEYRALEESARAGLDPLSRYLEYSPASKILVVGEENVLADPADAYTGDVLVIRLLAKALHQLVGTRPVDASFSERGRSLQQYELHVERLDVRFDARLAALYDEAMAVGKWRGTAAAHDYAAYWATGMLAYFDAAGQDAAPNDAPHPIRTREALRDYDPGLHALVRDTMAYEGHVDWRYRTWRD